MSDPSESVQTTCVIKTDTWIENHPVMLTFEPVLPRFGNESHPERTRLRALYEDDEWMMDRRHTTKLDGTSIILTKKCGTKDEMELCTLCEDASVKVGDILAVVQPEVTGAMNIITEHADMDISLQNQRGNGCRYATFDLCIGKSALSNISARKSRKKRYEPESAGQLAMMFQRKHHIEEHLHLPDAIELGCDKVSSNIWKVQPRRLVKQKE
jgi:hypothetical protein